MKMKIKTENKNFLRIFQNVEKHLHFVRLNIYYVFCKFSKINNSYQLHAFSESERYFRLCCSTQTFPYLLHIYILYY